MGARIINYDWLRAIGLTLIVLAHVQAPWLITQFRCFDVPLMIFVSALCYKPSNNPYMKYVIMRFARLYIPTLIFLMLFFLIVYIAKTIGIVIPYTKNQIIGSFLLCEKPSIGYVWIIRAFIIISLIAPFLYRLAVNSKNLLIFGSTCLGAFILAELLSYASAFITNPLVQYINSEILIYILSYGIIFNIGVLVKNLSIHRIINLSTTCLIILSLSISYLAYNNCWIPLSPNYKYPPHSYFIIYGIICSLILYAIPFDRIKSKKVQDLIAYISTNSMWIYLWHIPFVVLGNSVKNIGDYWVFKWLFCYIFAIIITFIQAKVVKMLERGHSSAIIKYLK